MSIILAHSGKQHSYQVAKALYNLNQLERFYTSSYITNSALQSYLLKKGNTFWTKRFIEGLPRKYVQSNWRFELPELIGRRLGKDFSQIQDSVYARDVNFDKYITKILSNYTSDNIFWGFQGSCLNALKKAKELGIKSIYELAAVYPKYSQEILREEKNLVPTWSDSIDSVHYPPDYYDRLLEEPFMADNIIVSNNFSKSIIRNEGISENKLITLPLGVDFSHIPPLKLKNKKKPLNLLFVGRFTQGKGLKYFLDALMHFDKREVTGTLIGSIQGSGDGLKPYLDRITIKKPIHQHELFNQYQDYHALVLPTLTEGFGLVIIEAMAAGLPVITTPHSIGPELITTNNNGFIVPIRNSDAIIESIQTLLEMSIDEYQQMQISASNSAKEYSWNSYQNRLEMILKSL